MGRSEAVGFINVTRQCNVDCKRCYLTEAHRASKERLGLETLERFLGHRFWLDRPVTLIWEGGEASVVGHRQTVKYCETARTILPHATQTMVTNCFSVPNWLIDVVHQQFSGQVETTYALGHKYSLSGSSDLYQQRFLAGLSRFWDAGINCPVNIELNAETIALGPGALAAVILNSNCRVWEFDLSVDFRTFLAAPEYSCDSTPVLPLTAPYSAVWGYLLDLKRVWGHAFKDQGITIGAFDQDVGKPNNQFNVACEDRFLTLNPDGVVTTNPLYSDLMGTQLGNVDVEGMDAILANTNRLKRIMADRKRIAPCSGCQHVSYCKGGPSHVPVLDGSGECAGGRSMWNHLLETASA